MLLCRGGCGVKAVCDCCLLPVLVERDCDRGVMQFWCPRTDQRSEIRLKCMHSFKWGDRLLDACVNCGQSRLKVQDA